MTQAGLNDLRCGVAGLGRGQAFVSAFNEIEACVMVAVCNRSPSALDAYPDLVTHTDYGEFLKEDLDIVAVVTPGPVHAEQSIQALEAGCHVICETPNVYSLDEAKSVIAAVKASGKKYMLAENYIWMGWVIELKKKIDDGLLGEIIYAEGEYSHDCRDIMLLNDGKYIPYKDRDRYPNAVKSWRATDFPPLVYVSHTLGPLLYLMQDRVVTAIGHSTGTKVTPDLGTIDLEAALLTTAKGAVIRLTNGFTIPHPMGFLYKLVGTKGTFQFMLPGKQAFFYSDAEDSGGNWQTIELTFGDRPDGRPNTEAMLEDFVRSIQNDTAEPLDVYRSIEMVLPGLLAHESAMQNGIKVDVPDLRNHTEGN